MGIEGTCEKCGFSPTLDYVCLRCTQEERDGALAVIGEMMKWCCSACGLFVKNDPAFLKAFAAKKPEAEGNPWAPNKDFPGKPVTGKRVEPYQKEDGENLTGPHPYRSH